jgi:hypothetical protein
MTTPPAPPALDTILRFDHMMRAWSLGDLVSGPAGSVPVLLLDDVRVSFDAVQPERLVELAVGVDDYGAVSASALDLVAALAGPHVADVLRGRATTTGDTTVRLLPSPGWVAAARLGRTQLLQNDRQAAHVLRDLDFVLDAAAVGQPGTTRKAAARAWRLWPTLVTLARSCRDVTMLSAVPSRQRDELRRRLDVVRALLGDDDEFVSLQSVAEIDGFRRALAAHHPDPERGARPGARADVGLPTVDLGRAYEHARDPAAPRVVGWRGSVDDVAARLGPALRLLHDGEVSATGSVPGQLSVRVPLALGVTDADLTGVVVRVCTDDDARPLGEGPLLVAGPTHAHVHSGLARIPLPADAGGRPYTGVEVDICARALPALDQAAVARRTRNRSVRAGQAAVAAATTGAFARSAAFWRECAVQWRECAAQLRRLGDEDRAETAMRHAEQAEQHADRTAARTEPAPDPATGTDWLTTALDGWSQWASAALADSEQADGADRVDRLEQLVESLRGWNEPSTELAEAHRALATVLRAEDEPDEDEIRYHLREALRIHYALNETSAALACLDELQ